MKKQFTLFFCIVLFTSCATIHINAWQDPGQCCDAFKVKKFSVGKDSLYLGVTKDTVSVLHITLAQTSRKYTIEGPDYCLLCLIDEKNDTIARASIGGMPGPGRPYTYTVFGSAIWKSPPDASKLRICLMPYCENIPLLGRK